MAGLGRSHYHAIVSKEVYARPVRLDRVPGPARPPKNESQSFEVNTMRTARSILMLLLLSTFVMLAMPAGSSAQVVGVSIEIAPPAIPIYEQPVCPGDDYLWTPGYWAYGDDGYYWVPGTWLVAPEVGFLWTPGYWGWGDGAYRWNDGYWGPTIGFYGGINYGFGYGGVGFGGGYWQGGHFFYNTEVMNVNRSVIHNVYSKTVVTTTRTRASFNGGNGGTTARPTAAEEAAAHERHVPMTSEQTQHQHEASTNRAQLASVNQGRPAVAATAKPGEFSGHGVVAAKAAGGRYVPAKTTASSRSTTSGSKETRSAATKESKPAATKESHTAATKESKPAATKESHTAATKESKPAATKESHTAATKESKPAATKESHTAATKESKPATTRESRPAATKESKPAATKEPKPAVTKESRPAPQPRTESKPPAQHESAPAKESKPAPAAHESASHPPAQHESAAPKESKKPPRL
jgi:hypothetical protein